MARATFSDRLRNIRPCGKCAPTGGYWMLDRDGNLRGRCDCLRGRLLTSADAARAKRPAA